LKGGKLSERSTARGIDVIERNAAAQRAIIDELLDISRIVTGKLKLDPDRSSFRSHRGAIDAVRPLPKRRTFKSYATRAQRGLVMGEAVRLQQVIWNLLSNAVKFTPITAR
jgi:signal transduction histidine kinase